MYPRVSLRRIAPGMLAAVCLGWVGTFGAVIPALAAEAGHGKPAITKSRIARLRTFPPMCLKQDGFGHIKAIGSKRWQGTTGEEPRTKRNDSAFVEGPFASDKQASRTASQDRRSEIAYAGGPFVVTATRVSYLDQETSLAAACLARSTESGGYKF